MKQFWALIALILTSCEQATQLPTAETTWTSSHYEIHIPSDWDSESLKFLPTYGREYSKFVFSPSSNTTARELLELDINLRKRFGEKYSLSILCQEGRFHWPVSKAQAPAELEREIDFLFLHGAEFWVANEEKYPLSDAAPLKDRITTYSEAARLTDTTPVVVLSTTNKPTLQQLINLFDFQESRSMLLIYEE